MFNNYLVEVQNNPVGILVREGDAYAFHALEPGLGDLEGIVFKDAFAAEQAARKTLQNRRKKA
ncbi:hypothetical protein [Mongoliimonas terrestris]|jgi:hypothetical protein|uniref:hypothetical protein n=1 Tax=Mongoliimonas terrestris TaxID=1709001 RepID=UPI000949825B|nr:hypothetical protein [Mongoliimonas terrestris]